MSDKLEIVIAERFFEQEEWQVTLVRGCQSFVVGPSWESRQEAKWYAYQLHRAIYGEDPGAGFDYSDALSSREEST